MPHSRIRALAVPISITQSVTQLSSPPVHWLFMLSITWGGHRQGVRVMDADAGQGQWVGCEGRRARDGGWGRGLAPPPPPPTISRSLLLYAPHPPTPHPLQSLSPQLEPPPRHLFPLLDLGLGALRIRPMLQRVKGVVVRRRLSLAPLRLEAA